jgi:hypothetical protein
VWAVGSGVKQQDTQGYPLAEHWTGSSWHPMTLPAPQKNTFGIDLVGVAGSGADNVWAVGSAPTGPLFEHWNGRSWRRKAVPDATRFTPAGVAVVSRRAAWAVGSYPGPQGGLARTRILRWNGSSWHRAGSPNPSGRQGYDELFAVSAHSARNVWAVGDYKRGSRIHTLVLHWNGSGWQRVGSPNPGTARKDVLDAVVAVGSKNVWAVGSYRARTKAQRPLVEHWDGRRWRVVQAPSANPTSGFDVLNAVSAASARDVWAVGNSGPGQGFAEHWDGKSWKVVPMPDQPPPFVGLSGVAAVSAQDAWAVGTYTAA